MCGHCLTNQEACSGHGPRCSSSESQGSTLNAEQIRKSERRILRPIFTNIIWSRHVLSMKYMSDKLNRNSEYL